MQTTSYDTRIEQEPCQRLREVLHTPGKRMLVVEDDFDLLNIVLRMAERLEPKMRVDRAADVDSALAQLDRYDYDIVLADYYLRGSRRGLDLREECAHRQPGAVFAMMSSLSIGRVLDLTARTPLPFLPKPFTPAELFGFLIAALDGAPTPESTCDS